MSHLHTPSVPDGLYARGIELGLLPRAQKLQPDTMLVWRGNAGPLLYRHAGALLAAGDLTAAERTALEDAGLTYARYVSSHPLQGGKQANGIIKRSALLPQALLP